MSERSLPPAVGGTVRGRTVLTRTSRLTCALTAVIAVVALAAGCGSSTGNDSNKSFVVGAGLPLTGNEAQYGTAIKKAEQAATSYVNAHGGVQGRKLQLSFWDTKSDPATGVAGTHYFISHHVNAVVGYFDSDVTIPSVKLLQQADIPLFGDNPSTPALATMKLKNFVRITANDKNEGQVQATFVAQKLGEKTAAVIDDSEIFGQAFASAFTSTFTKAGGKVLKRFSTEAATTDFGSILNQISSLHPEVVEYSGFNPAAALLVKQMRAAGIKAAYITDSSQYGAQFTNVAGKAAAGAYMTNLPSGGPAGGTSKKLFSYLQSALSKSGTSVVPIYANSFDAVLTVQQAAKQAKSTDGKDLIGVMHKVSFDGATGHVSFLSDGDRAQVRFTVVQVQPNLKYKTVYTYKRTES